MAYDLKTFRAAASAAREHLKLELASVRTGRATPAVLDRVEVEAYGSRQPIAHVATIATLDPRSLGITPWDTSVLKAIESALQAANLGLGIAPQGGTIRVSFPELSGERREVMAKLVREKLEEARIAVRHAREEEWDAIQSAEREKQISEDEKFRLKDALQRAVDEANGELESLVAKKEQELLE